MTSKPPRQKNVSHGTVNKQFISRVCIQSEEGSNMPRRINHKMQLLLPVCQYDEVMIQRKTHLVIKAGHCANLN